MEVLKVINSWPLVLIVEDSYYPNAAEYVLEMMAECSDALVDASAACDGLAAQIDAEARQN